MNLPPQKFQKYFQEVDIQDRNDNQIINLKLLKKVNKILDKNTVTSVSIIPFIRKNTIIATRLNRGIDIPGGHVELFDENVTATAIREALEEAGIELVTPLTLLGIVESDLIQQSSNPKSHMLITMAKIRKINNFKPNFESLGREKISLDNFLEQYHSTFHKIMSELFRRAILIQDEIL